MSLINQQRAFKTGNFRATGIFLKKETGIIREALDHIGLKTGRILTYDQKMNVLQGIKRS